MSATLWEIDIYPAPGQPDRLALQVAADAAELNIAPQLEVAAASGYLIQGPLEKRLRRAIGARAVCRSDRGAGDFWRVGEKSLVSSPPNHAFAEPRPQPASAALIHVLPKPGVMDPVAQSAAAAIKDFGIDIEAVRTVRKYWMFNLPAAKLSQLASKVLANDSIEQVVIGPLQFDRLELGSPYQFKLVTVPIREMDDEALVKLSREGQLYLSLAEMQTIQEHFRAAGRDPTDAELETLAQTWSEHCSHKTLAGRIAYRGPIAAGPANRRPNNHRPRSSSKTCSRRRFLPPRKKFARRGKNRSMKIGA